MLKGIYVDDYSFFRKKITDEDIKSYKKKSKI